MRNRLNEAETPALAKVAAPHGAASEVDVSARKRKLLAYVQAAVHRDRVAIIAIDSELNVAGLLYCEDSADLPLHEIIQLRNCSDATGLLVIVPRSIAHDPTIVRSAFQLRLLVQETGIDVVDILLMGNDSFKSWLW